MAVVFCVVAGVSLAVTVAAVPLLKRLARRLDVVDHPGHRKTHSAVTPLLGGVALLLGLAAGLGAFLGTDPALRPEELHKLLVVLGASALATLLGLADDKFLLRPRYKLAGQALICVGFVVLGYRFQALSLPGLGIHDLAILGAPLTILWMLTVVNGMNLIDGVDGLAGSVALVILCAIGLMSVYLRDVAAGALAVAGIGAVIGFLAFNWRPASIYMGDSGSLGLGMLIAAALVSLGRDAIFGVTAQGGEPFLYQIPLCTAVAAYPVLEVLLTVARRLLRGKPIGSADQGHIHHRLMHQGWQTPHICFAAVFFSVFGGGAAIYSLMQYRGAAMWFVLAGGLALGLGLHFTGMLDTFRFSSIRGSRPQFLLANHFFGMQNIRLSLVESPAELAALLAQVCRELPVQSLTLSVASEKERAVCLWRWPAVTDGVEPPPPAAGGLADRAQLADAQTAAEWVLDARQEAPEIAVEYRVLTNDFMRRALGKADEFCRRLGTEQVQAAMRDAPPDALLLLRGGERP